ncbi:MAG: flagellar FliJ family protein [Myxococcota bacterium]
MATESALAKVVWLRNVEEERARRMVARALDAVREHHASVHELTAQAAHRPALEDASLAQLADVASLHLRHRIQAANARLNEAEEKLRAAQHGHLHAVTRLRAVEHVYSLEEEREQRELARREQRQMDEAALMLRARRG